MAKIKRELIFATFIVSCAGTVLSIVALATQQWITSEVKATAVIEDQHAGSVNYGLFSGVFERYLLSSPTYNDISSACVFSENVCAFSTETTAEAREEEITDILNQKVCKNNVPNSKTNRDISRESLFSGEIEPFSSDYLVIDHHINWKPERIVGNGTKIIAKRAVASSISVRNNPLDTGAELQCDPTFLNAGLWLMTIFFLILSILLGTFTAMLSVMNTTGNPISPWLNIWGLYIWNGLASGSVMLTLMMWGIQYSVTIMSNVGIIVTLNGKFKDTGKTNLGYSYWILLAPMFLYISNIGIFKLRQYLINKAPPTPTIKHTERDGMIFVY